MSPRISVPLVGALALTTLLWPTWALARPAAWLLCRLPDDTYVQISVDYFGVSGAVAVCKDEFDGHPEGFF